MKIAIIGAGASGLASAIMLAKKGHEVIILEKKDRPAKKLLATGNGRCNFTNNNISIQNYHSANEGFSDYIVEKYPRDTVLDFFYKLGLEYLVNDNNKIFPMSLQSKNVLDILMREIKRLNIKIRYNINIDNIKKNGSFNIYGNENHNADIVILAAGGAVYKKMGSDGSGYEIAKSFGHSIESIFPGIVQLRLEENTKDINGVKFFGEARLYQDDKLIYSDHGDVLFTDYGISGPPILQISSRAMRLLNENIYLAVNLVYTHKDIYQSLLTRKNILGYLNLHDFLVSIINEKLIDKFLNDISMDKNKKISEFSDDEIKYLAHELQNWKFKIKGAKSLDDGQVTCGGISTKEVNNISLESNFVKNLFFVGEVLDVDGDCGGYNLHWAWISAMAVSDAIN